MDQKETDDTVEEINNRPRKCLGYYTPNEVFLSKLNKLLLLEFTTLERDFEPKISFLVTNYFGYNQRVAIQSGM